MNAKIKIVIVLVLFSFFFIPNVTSIGLSPPQLRITNAPVGTLTKVSTLRVTNTDDDPCFVILRISCLAKAREHKLRVICNGCNREIGIQRGDLLHPRQIKSIINETIITKENIQANISSFPNATIGDYVLIKDNFVQRIIPIEKKDNSFCPFCNSDDLIFYDFPPDDVLDNINIACKDNPLEKIGNRMYKTQGKIQPRASADIDIYLNISDIKEYYNQYWEARVMATAVSNMSEIDQFLIYGVEAKVLIDTPVLIEETVEKDNYPFLFLGITGISVLAMAIIIVFSILFFKSRKREIFIVFPKTSSKEKTSFKGVMKGRKLS